MSDTVLANVLLRAHVYVYVHAQLKVNTALRILDLDGNDIPLSFGEDAAELLEQQGGTAITRLCFRPRNTANLAGLTQAKLRVQQAIAAR